MKKSLLLLVVGLCLTGLAHAQDFQAFKGWSEPKVVSGNSDQAAFPAIAAEGSSVHVVFRQTLMPETQAAPEVNVDDLLREVRQIDRIIRAGSETRIREAGGLPELRKKRSSLLEQIEQAEQTPTRQRTAPILGPKTAICYIVSQDLGRTWSPPKPITYTPDAFYGQLDLVVADGVLYVAFVAQDRSSNLQVYATQSNDGGVSWADPVAITSSPHIKIDPCLVVSGNGAPVLTWWESDSAVFGEKEALNLALLENYLRDPVIRTQTMARSRSIVRYSSFIGGNWSAPQSLESINSDITYLNACPGRDGEVFIYWLAEGRTNFISSINSGTSWQSTTLLQPVFNQDHFYEFLFAQNNYQILRAGVQKDRNTPLELGVGHLSPQWTPVVAPLPQYSYPQMTFSQDHLHVIWGVTAHGRQEVHYFRQDFTPPRSRFVYPQEGSFTRSVLNFVWDATDDIAETIRFRHVLMKRENPDQRPEPVNWSNMAAAKSLMLEAPGDGFFSLFLESEDFSLNRQTPPTVFDFHTFYIEPELKVDDAALPPRVINTRNVELRWKSRDNNGTNQPFPVAYCLDGNPVSEFAPRPSIKITGLANGIHQVQLYTMDRLGNVNAFGEAVSFEVSVSLNLAWVQKPEQPAEEGRVFVREGRVPIAWKVMDNTSDPNVNFMSSFLVIQNGQKREWSPIQFSQSAELAGLSGSRLLEGDYLVFVAAQDEYGNLAADPIATAFTVDQTPPQIAFNQPTVDPDSNIPTVSVSASDNFSKPTSLVYQFRIVSETASAWTPWSRDSRYACAGNPIKWYSWGYLVEARAMDVAGNVNPEPITWSFRLFDRNPWIPYVLAGVVGLIVFLILFLVVSIVVQKKRQRKRAAARRAKIEAETPPPPQTEETVSDDLFDLDNDTQIDTDMDFSGSDASGGAAVSSEPTSFMDVTPDHLGSADDSNAGVVSKSAPTDDDLFASDDDPFASPKVPSDDPFASLMGSDEKPDDDFDMDLPAIDFGEDEPIELDLGGVAETNQPSSQPGEQAKPQPPKPPEPPTKSEQPKTSEPDDQTMATEVDTEIDLPVSPTDTSDQKESKQTPPPPPADQASPKRKPGGSGGPIELDDHDLFGSFED